MGVDFVGPLPLSKGKNKLCIMAIHHFTKWAQVEPLTTLTLRKTTPSNWKNIKFSFLTYLRSLSQTMESSLTIRRFDNYIHTTVSATTTPHLCTLERTGTREPLIDASLQD